MLGILGESYMLAARTDHWQGARRISGTIESPAAHDPERQWIEDDQRRRLYGRAARKGARRFWRRRSAALPD